MMKLVLMLALVGACAGVPVAQDGVRGDELTNVLIHSGYANIRRQGRMHDSGAFNSQRFKKGRTLDVDAIKSDLDKVDPAPVFKGFSDEESQSEETQELKEKVEAASKLAIEKMEKDIMNAITSIPSENANEEATTQSFKEIITDSEEEVAITEKTVEETTTSDNAVPTTNAPIASVDTTLTPEVTETESEKEEEEEVTAIPEEVPATNSPVAASTSIPESVTKEIISQETTTTDDDDDTPTTTNTIITTSIPEADSEKTTGTPIASTVLDNDEEAPVSTTMPSQNQQPSEDLDLGSVEEVIS